MCAKKAASASAKKTPTATNRKISNNGKGPSPASAVSTAPTKKPSVKSPPPSASQRTLSHQHIGEVAGELWQLLSTSDSQTLAAIKKAVDAPADVVVAALGWLGREDKLEFVVSGRTVKLSLKK